MTEPSLRGEGCLFVFQSHAGFSFLFFQDRFHLCDDVCVAVELAEEHAMFQLPLVFGDLRQQLLDAIEVAPPGGLLDGAHVVLVKHIRVCAALKKKFNDRGVPLSCCQEQRRFAVLRLSVHIGLLVQEMRADGHMASQGSDGESLITTGIFFFHLRHSPSLGHLLDKSFLPTICCQHQQCPIRTICHLVGRVCPQLQKGSDFLLVAFVNSAPQLHCFPQLSVLFLSFIHRRHGVRTKM
mmetsp:Transcript_45480/g.97456  ORF Transcript_45480/g.97456 Transcript_45480/m.97456 type:complete len:238 (+) Transcript_45480:107-820(+)